MQAALAGFALGMSLIVAIGAQNAFVLRQGIVRAHVFPVAAICAASDAVLIAAGVAGFGALTGALPWLETAMRWVGAAFLLWYGLRSWRAAWRGEGALRAGAAAGSLRAAVLTCLALTWLNPHVYLDTVMLLGAVSAQYEDRTGFALGAMAASVLFFFTLAYAGRLLAPVFARPAAWRVLDLGIGAVMLALAARLASGQ
ncbi:LysE/ArgO family amino acid transporter [Salipiger thiooxidans]|jgi:L-lysine exporter family protein LysE/ArgO|uniref:LysE/ArgO family amino acid transporter n=1 Tax=Salipiger thiooxidans TaxID=282683 RepID=UPI001A8CDA99|nr:LysE/ArgO family amino acid transporter [Salipiger thiooxidans]MBN8187772.1 amino acid transporter [Salipiger thiooxidans]MBR9838565.1 amino acid transporter [Paracoccaceae bacterium]MCA0850994.1 LysE/ArgO family amino acid transporter [Salipiger thiooxidans]